MVARRFQLDISKPGNQALMYARKGDARVYGLYITLVENSVPIDLADCTVALRCKKPDGTQIFNAGIVDNGVALIYLTSQTLSAAGVVRCELDVYGADSALLYSPAFDIYVESQVLDDDDIESASEYTALANALAAYQTQKNAVDALAARIEYVLGQIGDNPLAQAISAVTYVEQELTEEQKAVARGNIGAISADEVDDETTGKADKVISPTTGNFAGLDANGNLTDSGNKAADFATTAQGELADSALQAADIANALNITEAGKVLDARQGKALSDLIAANTALIGQSASPYAHTKIGTVHNFVGTGKLGFAKLTADYADGDSVTVNGNAVTVVGDLSDGVTDAAVLFSLNDAEMFVYAIASPFVVPDGDTATPVNDLETWLNCAGLQYSVDTLPTLTEVMGSATLCETLMNSQNAIKYLERSETLQGAVSASATAIAALDASNPIINPYMTANSQNGYTVEASGHDSGLPYYVCDASIDTSINNWGDQTGDYGTLTATLTLPYPIWIYKIYILAPHGQSNVLCSANGVDYEQVGTANGGANGSNVFPSKAKKYKYVRIQVTGWTKFLYELRVYGKD